MTGIAAYHFVFGISLVVNIVFCNANIRKSPHSLRRGPGEGHAIFRKHPFSKLNVTPTFVEAVKTYKQCLRDCAANPNCSSANFGTKEVLKGVLLCELLPKDRYNASSSFVSPVQGFVHYSIKTPCFNSPCQHGGTCIANYLEDTYKCLCKTGLNGQDCKEDVDECTTLSNPCNANATCVNVLASYTCTCNQGFTGDGQTCNLLEPSSSEVKLLKSRILKHIKNYPAFDQTKEYLLIVHEGGSWKRCWWAAYDGWDVKKTFHPLCDGRGPTVTFIRKDDYVYGGYADKSWRSPSTRTAVASNKAFLFSLTNINGYQPVMLNVSDSQNALIHDKNFGPIFGSGFDMCVGNNATSTASSFTRPKAYSHPPNYCNSTASAHVYCDFFAGVSSPHTLSDVEVFYKNNYVA